MRTCICRIVLALSPGEFRSRFHDEMLDTARTLDRIRGADWRDSGRAIADAIRTICAIRHDLRVEHGLRIPTHRRQPMNGLWQDVRFAARRFRRHPWFAMFIVIALTLGIGANAAMFGIADRLILSGPQHIRDSARVVRMYLTASPDGRRQFTTSSFGHVSYELARRASAFDEVATYAVNDILVGDGATAKIAHGGYASAGLFPLLGVAPALGRFFRSADDRPGSAQYAAVLSVAA